MFYELTEGTTEVVSFIVEGRRAFACRLLRFCWMLVASRGRHSATDGQRRRDFGHGRPRRHGFGFVGVRPRSHSDAG